MFARQLALDAKIESSQIALQTRNKALKAEMQKELQRAIEKKLRKATKSEGLEQGFPQLHRFGDAGALGERRDEKVALSSSATWKTPTRATERSASCRRASGRCRPSGMAIH